MHEHEHDGVATAGQAASVDDGTKMADVAVAVGSVVNVAAAVVAGSVGAAEPDGAALVGTAPEGAEPEGPPGAPVPEGKAPDIAPEPEGGEPPGPPPMPEFAFATPPSSVSVEAADTVCVTLVSMPIAAHARIPSEGDSPRRTYSSIGSISSASSERMLSSSLSVWPCVLLAYGSMASTDVMRS